MRKIDTKLGLKLAGLVLGLSLFGWVVHRAFEQSQSVEWGPLPTLSLIIATLIVIVAHGVRCFAWTVGARHMSSRLGWLEGTSIYSVTFLARYIPGKIWQIGGISAMTRKNGANPVNIAAYSLIFMIAYQLLGALTILLVYLVRSIDYAMWICLLLSPAIALCLAVPYHLLGSTIASKLPNKIGDILNQSTGQSFTSTLVILTLLVTVWIMLASSAFALIDGFAPGWNGNWALSSIAVIGGLMAGFLVLIAPSGAGVRESAISLGLTELGVAAVTSIAIVVWLRIVMTIAELFWAAIGMAVIWFSSARNQDPENENPS